MSIKERWLKAKEKTLIFLRKHSAGIIVGGLVISGIGIGVSIGIEIGQGKERKRVNDWIESRESYLLEKLEEERAPLEIDELNSNEPDNNEANTEDTIADGDDIPFWSRGWSEDLYREDYEKVKALANELNLHPGESWFIEEASQFGDLEEAKPVISHMINGTGVYPPNEE